MEMAIIKPGENLNDPRFRRSHVCKIVTRQLNKFINLPVLKHHQSAGVTIALKNMSHGMVNNVNRSHMTPTSNVCGDLHSVGREPAGDPREGGAAYLRCGEGVVSRRPYRQGAVHVGAQDHVLRYGSSGSR